jgi:hypothetical protein
MNKFTAFERKITLESDLSDFNPRTEPKSPSSRIMGLKSLSFKELPFSQHIFG